MQCDLVRGGGGIRVCLLPVQTNATEQKPLGAEVKVSGDIIYLLHWWSGQGMDTSGCSLPVKP